MGKLQATIKSEIMRLAKRELHKVSVPLKRDVRLLKKTVSQIRKSVLPLERFAAQKQKELSNREIQLEASPEEVKQSRFSPRLFRASQELRNNSEGAGDPCRSHCRGSAFMGEREG